MTNGQIVTDAIEKANTFNSYYSMVFSSEDNIPNTQGENIGDPFTMDIKEIRKRIKAIGKNKSVGQTGSREKFSNWEGKP